MKSLSIRYRPDKFEDVCSQESIIMILKRQLELEQFSNVYLFAGPSGCVDSKTEYFNGTCWKYINEFKDGDEVLVYHEDGTASLEKPLRYIEDNCDEMTLFKSKYGMNMCLSDEHRIIYVDRKAVEGKKPFKLKEITCEELLRKNYTSFHEAGPDIKLITTFDYEGEGIELSDAQIRVMCMTMADGSFSKGKNKCCLNLKKERKINRAFQLLNDAGISYNVSKVGDYTRIYYYAPRKEKVFNEYWYNCNKHQMEIICDEVMYWDGDFNSKACFNSAESKSLDFVQFAFACRGIKSTIPYGHTKEKTKKVILADGSEKSYYYPEKYGNTGRVIVTKKHSSYIGFPRYKKDVIKVIPENNKKYCFTVSTGMWIMRREGCICVTGNCGKTTLARIFANEINKHKGTPIEIDAASNSGVDNVRLIINAANERSLDSEYKIYIIDEAHALSNNAWQALLKTIEEPPKYTMFMFCTTDPQKVPDTIKNRCMRFNLTRIPYIDIMYRLMFICKNENYINYEETCDYIARTSKGQMRDAIATLEKCATYSNDLSIENSLKAISQISYDALFHLINFIIDGDEEKVMNVIESFYLEGYDLKLFVDQFLDFCLDLAKYCIGNNLEFTHLPSVYEDKIRNAVGFENNINYYTYIVDKLFELKNFLKNDLNPKITIDIYMLRMTRCQ